MTIESWTIVGNLSGRRSERHRVDRQRDEPVDAAERNEKGLRELRGLKRSRREVSRGGSRSDQRVDSEGDGRWQQAAAYKWRFELPLRSKDSRGKEDDAEQHGERMHIKKPRGGGGGGGGGGGERERERERERGAGGGMYEDISY